MLKKILLLAAALVAFVAAPAAAQYPETGVLDSEISNTNPQPGEAFTVSGTCEADDTVVVALSGVGTLATIPVGDDGSFSGSVTIPSDLAPGTYTLTVTCGPEVQSFTITVGGATGGTGSGPLARTGSSGTGRLVQVGGVLLLAGAAVALVASKRRTTHA